MPQENNSVWSFSNLSGLFSDRTFVTGPCGQGPLPTHCKAIWLPALKFLMNV